MQVDISQLTGRLFDRRVVCADTLSHPYFEPEYDVVRVRLIFAHFPS